MKQGNNRVYSTAKIQIVFTSKVIGIFAPKEIVFFEHLEEREIIPENLSSFFMDAF